MQTGKMHSWTDLIRHVEVNPMLDHICVRLTSGDLIGCSYGRIYHTMRKDNRLPNILPKEEKSNKLPKELRNRGNVAYVRNKDNPAAIQLYTKAICAALPNIEEMALAYANRSAVTCDIGVEFSDQTEGMFAFLGFNDSIRDIDRALASGSYPDHLKYKLYERRGKCLMYQGKNSEASDDLELAKTHIHHSRLAPNRVESLISVIEANIKVSRSSSYAPVEDHPYFPNDITLSHEPSPYIECASSAVDITYYQKMGRGVVAARDIRAGDVLTIEKYYVSALFPSFFLDHCDNCMVKCLSPIPCPSCNTIVYCSERCHQSSWTAYHLMECRILPSLLAYFQATEMSIDHVLEMHLALRLFLRVSKCGVDMKKLLEEESEPSDPSKSGFVDGKYLSDDYSVIHLVTNLKTFDEKFKVMFIGQAIALMCLLRDGTSFFEFLDASSITRHQSNRCCPSELTSSHLTVANLLLKCCMIVRMNSIKVIEAGLEPTGIAVYPFFSLFNHSCDPNIVNLAYASDIMFVTALQPIPKGQQLFTNLRMSYQVHPRSLRQQLLKRYHRFTCECTPCVEDWPLRIVWPEKPIFTRPHFGDHILGSVKAVEKALEDVYYGERSRLLLVFLVWFVDLVFESVKLPWEPYAKAQEAIKMYRSYQAMPELPTIILTEESAHSHDTDSEE